MPVEVEVHSTAKRGAAIIGIAILLAAIFLFAKFLRASADVEQGQHPSQDKLIKVAAEESVLLPVVKLAVSANAHETEWSSKLAEALGGRTEVSVPNGRIDVLTNQNAIEVERLKKWHEGIGQAAHYSSETGEIGCLALVLEDNEWPLSDAETTEIRTIEKTALKQGLKLILLRRLEPKT